MKSTLIMIFKRHWLQLIIKMKQFQLQQVKFPKPQPHAQPIVPSQNQIKQKPTIQSEMIRIIIALLIAIFIYNSSQQTTINYNEIIKNQKMFLVKNIRGVIPTLSGDIYKLQDGWKVVHFQNYHQNDSQIFNNYTFAFNSSFLVVQNKHCNSKMVYNWKNYSYNIDFLFLKQTIRPLIANTQNTQLSNHSLFNTQNTNLIQSSNQSTLQDQTSSNKSYTQTKLPLQPTENAIDLTDAYNSVKVQQGTPPISAQQQKQIKCTQNMAYFKEVILFTSVWTISGHNLYLLLENALLDEDYYMILKPLS